MVWSEGYDDKVGAEAAYGNPVSGKLAAEAFGPERGEFPVTAFLLGKDSINVKDRRGNPEVFQEDFFASLVESPDGRFFFSGVLNGWGGLSLLELGRLETSDKTVVWEAASSEEPTRVRKYTGKLGFKANKVQPVPMITPGFPKGAKMVIATLFMPKWSDFGYSKEVPGHVWYYSGGEKIPEMRKVAIGTNCIKAANELDMEIRGKPSVAVNAYHFGHRYAKMVESIKDNFSYHTAVFIEWDHGEHGTVIELAWRHGTGGFRGKSNWVRDKDAKPWAELYGKMPAECKLPWEMRRSEARIIDVPSRNIEEFEGYLQEFTGKALRFIDPKVKYSGKVALKKNTKADIAGAVLNRMIYHNAYNEPTLMKQSVGYNCQTFAASLFGYLTKLPPKTFSLGLKLPTRVKWFQISHEDGLPAPAEYYKPQKLKKRTSLKYVVSKIESVHNPA